jgi:hypothetical protein
MYRRVRKRPSAQYNPSQGAADIPFPTISPQRRSLFRCRRTHLYSVPHLVAHGVSAETGQSGASARRIEAMQDRGSELPRVSFLRGWVNSARWEGTGRTATLPDAMRAFAITAYPPRPKGSGRSHGRWRAPSTAVPWPRRPSDASVWGCAVRTPGRLESPAGGGHDVFPTDLRGRRSGEGKADRQHGRPGGPRLRPRRGLYGGLVEQDGITHHPGKPQAFEEWADRARGGAGDLGGAPRGTPRLGTVAGFGGGVGERIGRPYRPGLLPRTAHAEGAWRGCALEGDEGAALDVSKVGRSAKPPFGIVYARALCSRQCVQGRSREFCLMAPSWRETASRRRRAFHRHPSRPRRHPYSTGAPGAPA